MEPSCFACTSGARTSTLRWSAQTAQSLETDYSFSFVWMISTRHCQERALVAALTEEPHVNPNTGTKEFALRDPDGYYVMISALSAA
jgi:hypothetical protein